MLGTATARPSQAETLDKLLATERPAQGLLTVVAPEKLQQVGLKHQQRLGEGECLADEPGETLAQAVVEAFDVGSEATLFANRNVLTEGDDVPVLLQLSV